MKFSWDFPGIFRSRKSGMEFSIYLHSRSRKWEWNLPFTFTFPFPKMGMEFAISRFRYRSRSRSPKVIPAHGCIEKSSTRSSPASLTVRNKIEMGQGSTSIALTTHVHTFPAGRMLFRKENLAKLQTFNSGCPWARRNCKLGPTILFFLCGHNF